MRSSKSLGSLILMSLSVVVFAAPAHSDDLPTWIKVMDCKVAKDTTGGQPAFQSFSLYAPDMRLEQSGTGLLIMRARSHQLFEFDVEIASPISMMVKDGQVNLNLLGTEKSPQYVSFSKEQLEATMDPKAKPMKILIPGTQGEMELACQSPIKLPFLIMQTEKAEDLAGVKPLETQGEPAVASPRAKAETLKVAN